MMRTQIYLLLVIATGLASGAARSFAVDRTSEFVELPLGNSVIGMNDLGQIIDLKFGRPDIYDLNSETKRTLFSSSLYQVWLEGFPTASLSNSGLFCFYGIGPEGSGVYVLNTLVPNASPALVPGSLNLQLLNRPVINKAGAVAFIAAGNSLYTGSLSGVSLAANGIAPSTEIGISEVGEVFYFKDGVQTTFGRTILSSEIVSEFGRISVSDSGDALIIAKVSGENYPSLF